MKDHGTLKDRTVQVLADAILTGKIRPGERLNLDRILTLLEIVAKSQVESEKLLKEVCEKLSALEAQSFVLSATSPSQRSTQNSTG